DAEKVTLLTRSTQTRRDALFPRHRARLIEILNISYPGKELFRQLGMGRVRLIRLRFRLACGLAERPF
ncbi:MAG TPA: hypothetical protein VJU02_04025, partial [Nitrospiraceae bacterium]|nr:hypothetical protein [Nitrospiraceae bacterium]